MENHNFLWENSLFLWPFSIAILTLPEGTLTFHIFFEDPRIPLLYDDYDTYGSPGHYQPPPHQDVHSASDGTSPHETVASWMATVPWLDELVSFLLGYPLVMTNIAMV